MNRLVLGPVYLRRVHMIFICKPLLLMAHFIYTDNRRDVPVGVPLDLSTCNGVARVTEV